MPDPIYRGEGILLRWGESSANGRTVTFQIGDGPDDAERHPFYTWKTGRDHGQRFALVAVPLAENENDSAAVSGRPSHSDAPGLSPEAGSGAAGRPALTEGERLVQQAGILCGDERFQKWIILGHVGRTLVAISAAWAANLLREKCGIASRRELATNEAAAEKFRALVARYKSETGQMAEPRG